MAVLFHEIIKDVLGVFASARCLYFLVRIFQTRSSRTGKDFDVFNVPICGTTILIAAIHIIHSYQSSGEQTMPSCNVHFIVFGYTLVSACFAYLSTNCAEIAGEKFHFCRSLKKRKKASADWGGGGLLVRTPLPVGFCSC